MAPRIRLAATEGIEWEHVSARIVVLDKKGSAIGGRVPTWNEMCWIKNLFFEEEEAVVQFHPPKSEYVNNHPHVLHLWRHKAAEFPRPPKIFV
jgi:hypothetical protein